MIINVVLDTNIFISGIFWYGNYCSQIIDLWRNGKLILVSSLETVQELVGTLRDFRIKMPEEIIEEWRTMVIENSVFVWPTEKFRIVKEDPDDDKFIEAALAGKAQYLISQDKSLLKLKEFREIKIVTPEEFLKIIDTND